MLSLEENQSLNEHPRFNKPSFKTGQMTPVSSYSFCVGPDGKFASAGGDGSVNTGCHAFVRQRVYGTNHRLCVILPQRDDNCFYTNEEIEEYVNLLKEIGFDIIFEGQMTHQEIKDKYNKCGSTSISNLVFTLGEDYKGRVAENRYTALCYLRCLWSRWSFWLPYRFIEFVKYFKKRKTKPSLSKILILANLCPYGTVTDDYLIEAKIIIDYDDNGRNISLTKEKCDTVITESALMSSYYGFIGHCGCNVSLPYKNQENHKIVLNSFMISLLLVAPNNFNLVKYIEEHDELRKNKDIPRQGENRIDIGKTRTIVDYNRTLTNKLRDLLREKQYYKAFLYLKEVAQNFTQFADNHFSRLSEKDITAEKIVSVYSITDTDKAEKFIKELDIEENKSKNEKKARSK